MGEPAEDNIQNEHYDLLQRICVKRTFYPEKCASLLYKTLKAEKSALEHAVRKVQCLDNDEKILTNTLSEIQALSLTCTNKELEEFGIWKKESEDHLNGEDLLNSCDSMMKKCQEAQTALKQIKNVPNDNTTKHLL